MVAQCLASYLASLSPTTLQISVGAIALAHVIALISWVTLVSCGMIGTRTAWDVPAQEAPVSRARAAARARAQEKSAKEREGLADSEGAVRRRRRKEKRAEEAAREDVGEGDSKKTL